MSNSVHGSFFCVFFLRWMIARFLWLGVSVESLAGTRPKPEDTR